VPAIRVAQLDGLLTAKQPEKDITIMVEEKSITQRNPAYTAWMVHDQAVLGYVFSSLTRETLMHVL
jgi:hypothetical protein